MVMEMKNENRILKLYEQNTTLYTDTDADAATACGRQHGEWGVGQEGHIPYPHQAVYCKNV